MNIRHLVFSLLPVLAVAEQATTVPDDEPLLPPLPEELLSPPKGGAELPATARPVVSYRAPEDDEQTWLRLFYLKGNEEWSQIFRRMADASHEKDMHMCHGYSLWLKGHDLIHLRYDDDLSLSGIHADGHSYGVLYVEFSPYGIRVSPMEGYDLSGEKGGVCWQDAPSRLWSWADSGQFWAELPKLLQADKSKKSSAAKDAGVKREVGTKGQRMVVFWASAAYPVKAWWNAFKTLHAAVGPQRFSLIAPDGLNLWTDVVVPVVSPSASSSASSTVSSAPVPAVGAVPVAPAPKVPAPTVPAVTPQPAPATTLATPTHPAPPPAPASADSVGVPSAETPPAAPTGRASTSAPTPTQPPAAGVPPVPDTLHPASGSPASVAPDASVRPWALEGNVAPVPSSAKKKKASSSAPSPATPPQAAAPAASTPAPPAAPAPAAPATATASAPAAPAPAEAPAPPPAPDAAPAPPAATTSPAEQAAPPTEPPPTGAPASSTRRLENVGNIIP